ncbi:Aste57867_23181 [Aphanomyces stellatus]|uniref:Aste57867_23181 protein n=1 Tax=Aphanomyces stellatus TaxID=120398 RepID=A0A485LMH3_9STRA|nr:hypothetical protein As57867_023110 [Aphanomyces stellatus]VFT99829.1 Aste57867_23181 [Aphanomyces stellatus]
MAESNTIAFPGEAAANSSTLRMLVSLSRHGSRRPNPIAKYLCPNNHNNSETYLVPPAQLTQLGMQQMRAVGEEVRREYVTKQGYLSSSISGPTREHFETYFRSDSADRCAQSAISMGYGLYPDGTGPEGFPHQPIAVYMQLIRNEHDFAATEGPCQAISESDVDKYFETRAQELIKEHAPMLETVGQLCGINIWDIPTMTHGEDIVTGIKDIADAFTFDTQHGLPRMAGLTPALQAEIEGLAFQNLMERYYSTPEEITYWVAGFPFLLLDNLKVSDSPSFKYYSYHGHRELLHGMGMLLGWTIDFDGEPRAMNNTALHPATTMFFELHQENESTTPFVRAFMWSPQTNRTAVKLGKCSVMDCPLDEFTAIITDHIQATGTWEEICDYTPATFAPVVHDTTKSPPTAAASLRMPLDKTHHVKGMNVFAHSDFGWVVLSALIAVIFYVAIKYRRRHSVYRSL